MKYLKIFLLVSVLGFASIDLSRGAAGIQESNLAAVVTIDPRDTVRVDLMTTTGYSRRIASSNLANVLTLPTQGSNQLIKLLTAQSYTNWWDRDFKGQDFPNVRRRINTNGTIHVIPIGDSLINGATMWGPLYNYFFTNYGYGGVIGMGGQGYLNPRVETNATVRNGSFDSYSTWYPQFYTVPTGGCVTWTNANDAGGTLCNIITLDYVSSNGFGTFKIQTNLNNTGWVDMIASVNASSGASKLHARTGVTNSFSSKLQMRAIGLTGTNIFLAGGLINDGTNGGAIYNEMSLAGSLLDDFNKVPTNITWRALQQWNPQLIVMQYLDSASSLYTNVPKFLTNFHQFLPNCDFLGFPPNPLEGTSTNADALAQGEIMRTNCLQWSDHFFDIYGIYRDWNTGLTNGFLQAGLDPHPTTSGYKFEADCIAAWLDLFPDTKTYPGRIPYLTSIGKTLDIGSGGSILLTGPFSTSAGPIQWNFGNGSQTNGILYFNPVAGGLEWIFRDISGGGYNPLRIQTVSGSSTIFVGDNAAGSPGAIGSSALGLGTLYNTNFIKRPTGGAASVAGQVLMATDTGGTGEWHAPSNTYALTLMSSAANTPADSTTYYVGGDFGGNDITSYNQARVLIPKAGTIKRVWVKINMTVASSVAETCTISLRLNNTTDTTVANQNWSVNPSEFDSGALSIAVASGDFIALKFAHPAWTTNPTGVRIYAIVSIE